MSKLSRRERSLYNYAISCALDALVRHAVGNRRGWYHWLDNAPIVVEDIW